MDIKNFFAEIYEQFIFNKSFLKLARFFHFVKISPKQLDLNNNDKCLLLAPHPDDEIIGCGGTLIKHNEIFDIICLTDGRYGSYQDTEDLVNTRKEEFNKVMNELNIKYFSFLNIADRNLIHNYDIFKQINIEKYNYIFIPNYFDQHKDHKAVTVLLQRLLKEAPHKKDLKIVFYELWSPHGVYNYFININGFMERKKELINLYKSQTKYIDFAQGMEGLSKYRKMTTLYDSECFAVFDKNTFMKIK